MKNNMIGRSSVALALFFTIALFGKAVFAESAEKPRVAIKAPTVGEGVSKNARAALNIPKLLAEMEASLQSTRKFEVLSRSKATLSAVREEQMFAKSDLSKGNAAQEGALENADYLIIPTVQDFVFYRSAKAVPNLDSKYLRSDSGRLEINAQILDASTGAIKTTFYMKSSFATKEGIVNTRSGSPSSEHFTTMAKKVSAQMADQLVDTVFPMRVMSSQSGKVWINRGQDGGLKEGDMLNLYRPGEALIDPDTGESLGSAEVFLAKVKVVRVNPKFTIAEISGKGPDNPPQKDDILRKP